MKFIKEVLALFRIFAVLTCAVGLVITAWIMLFATVMAFMDWLLS